MVGDKTKNIRDLFLPGLSSKSARIKLCLSTMPLLNGDSAFVVLIIIPRFSHMFVNMLLVKPPPLSARNLFGNLNIDISF